MSKKEKVNMAIATTKTPNKTPKTIRRGQPGDAANEAEAAEATDPAEAAAGESAEFYQYKILDTAFFPQFVEAFAQSLRSIKHQSMPGIIDLRLLDGVRMEEGLEVLRDGTLVQGLTMWEALLTPDVQETLLDGLLQTLSASWSNAPATAVVSPLGEVIVFGTSPTQPVPPDQVDAPSIKALSKGATAPHYITLAEMPGTPVKRSTGVGKADQQLLNSLRRFADLQANYLRVLFMPAEAVARELSETVTDALIGYVSGVTDRTVRNWISGKHSVRRGNALKLRVMLAAVRILLEVEGPKVTQRWFATTNPHLAGNAPADMLREGEQLDWVIRSAAAYAEEGV